MISLEVLRNAQVGDTVIVALTVDSIDRTGRAGCHIYAGSGGAGLWLPDAKVVEIQRAAPKVGETVELKGRGSWIIMAINGDQAWVKGKVSGHCHTEPLSALIRE